MRAWALGRTGWRREEGKEEEKPDGDKHLIRQTNRRLGEMEGMRD